jgi:hypothetical protein
LPLADRSLPLARLAPLSQVPGVRLISLQTGPAAREVHDLPKGFEVSAWTEELEDFADTAALMANLDLIVTIDTAAAHLAGALAKPVWVMLRHPPDWRWMLHREDSPWYPTMRLFRQERRGDWTAPIGRIAQALHALAGQRG